MPEGRDIWKRPIRVVGWTLLCIGTLSLFVAAMNTASTGLCAGVRISYASGGKGTYVRQNDALRWLGFTTASSLQGKPLNELDLRAMEQRLEKEPWVGDAEIYIDRNRVMHVQIREREPVARIFTTEGLSFFIDSSTGMIPINPSHTPRVTVFTGLPVNGKAWARRDSLLISEVRDVARSVGSDSIMSAQVEQVDLDPVKGFVLIPKMGEHVIVIGDSRDLPDKFRRLKIFYQQVLSKTGWSMYKELDLRFRGQVVAAPTHPAPASSTSMPLTVSTQAVSATALKEESANAASEPSKGPVKKNQEDKGATSVKKPKAVMPERG
jgi:cell division protein FtsQ